MILYIAGILALLYFVFLIFLIVGWTRIPRNISSAFDRGVIPVSILVAARNEEGHLESLISSIASQKYPHDSFELIVVNDHSSDGTAKLLSKLKAHYSTLNIQTIDSKETGKKAALHEGILQSRYDYIITTDADCTMNEEWLATMTAGFHQDDFVAGPVVYKHPTNIWNWLMQLDLLSLVGAGAALIRQKVPLMCNAANMGFKKSLYLEYMQNTDHQYTSGDDVFLLQYAGSKNPNSISFVKDVKAVVSTEAPASFSHFYQQRIRWASKWKGYMGAIQPFIAPFIFLVHASFILLFVMAVMVKKFILAIIITFLIKIFLEFIFLRKVSDDLFANWKNSAFLFSEILYSPYAVFFGIAANFERVRWKNRVTAK